MKKVWIFVAVASLFLAAGRSRSQDGVTVPAPVLPDVAAGALDSTQLAPGAKCLTLQQRLQEWGKVRPASDATAASVEPISPPSPDTPPPTLAAPAVAQIPPGAPCLAGPGHRCFREQLVDWLTYRPLSHNICDCFPRCVPCCEPRLYLFFIGPCCVNPAEGGGRLACARNTACGCRDQCTGPREQPCKCCSGTGLGSFHLWHGWDDLLFNRPKNCAHTACAADDGVTDLNAK
jgi:hypothetical protein